jgi:RNA polymerase sigma-70 factor (ECF subfamily)
LKEKDTYNLECHFASFKSGEEKGFNFFFKKYYASLTWFATSLVKDEETAKDLVEECFIKFWQKRDTIRHARAIKYYLYTVVRNASLEFLRKQKKVQAGNSDFAYLHPGSDQPVLHSIIEAEVLSEVYTGLKALSPQCRKVLEMLYVEGKGYQQIAKELDLSIRTIKNHRGRGLAQLQQRLLWAVSLLLLFM